MMKKEPQSGDLILYLALTCSGKGVPVPSPLIHKIISIPSNTDEKKPNPNTPSTELPEEQQIPRPCLCSAYKSHGVCLTSVLDHP